MKCPECGARCEREEVDVGVGIIVSDWTCPECSWDEGQSFPMDEHNWQEWLSDGPQPDDYIE